MHIIQHHATYQLARRIIRHKLRVIGRKADSAAYRAACHRAATMERFQAIALRQAMTRVDIDFSNF